MKATDIKTQISALNALEKRLSPGSFATGFVGNLATAATSMDVIVHAKTGDTVERRAQRISEAGQKFLQSVDRTRNEINQREMGGLAALNAEFAERVGLSIDGFRYTGQVVEAVRSASQQEKVKILTQIVESGDGKSLAAIMEAPAFVHGIEPGMLSQFRDSMEQKFTPDITAKRERFKADLDVVRAALQSAEAIAQSTLKIENVSEALAEADRARDAEQRLAAATA